ncbi:MAG: hypothetical protein KA797_04105 [Chitinophagales bacterium]|nr:hypothetical protein [Chitinophagales bacterium]
MKIYILLFFNLSLIACQSSKIETGCIYNITKHESKVTDSTHYKKYSDGPYLVYDERENNVGFIYVFRKQDSMFNNCVFYHSDSTYGLVESYDFDKKLYNREGSIIFAHNSVENKDGTHIIVNYHLFNRDIKNAKFEQDSVVINVKVSRDLYCTNSYYSVIFLEGTLVKDLSKSKMYFMADIIGCDGKIEKLRERIYFK